MTSTNQLEFKGNIERHPVAELFVEFTQKELTGSLRLVSGEKKTVVYFESGECVFAVSNARCHRLYELLLNQEQIDKKCLAEVDEFTNDFHLAHCLVENGVFTKPAIDAMFVFQINDIIKDAFGWAEGEFVFSAAARIKSDIHFDIDVCRLLDSYLDGLDESSILNRFASLDESFVLQSGTDLTTLDINPHEAFILSRLGTEPVSAGTLRAMSGMESDQILPVLYRFWFYGLVSRYGWAQAIGAEDTSKISEAKLELKQSARSFEEELELAAKEAAEEAERIRQEELAAEETEEEQSLDEYLENVESAATHYEIFGVSPDAKLEAIKKSYFSLAKRFHPDLYYRKVDDSVHSRVQNAFTEIAQAYETLKNEESREIYDFKLRKVIEQLREARSQEDKRLKPEDLDASGHIDKAAENFERGYDYLLKDKFEEAMPFLARAVEMDGKNARYHAFYGQALSSDKDSHRKAEAELQLAVKLAPQNAQYKLMLAKLFIEIGLKVRAKGELTRLLEQHPDYKEAAALLDTL